ncbi:MAG: YdcF family protein [Alphaproteobacteria bacterium]|nr:YdcF family protein [Alphaproteobacteria bacterium]MBN2675143.1 YdcF family protein [Alphaproteobacteria bacterium]
MKFFNPSLLVLSFFVLGGAIFKSTTPTRCSTILSYDSIFVLTGDSRRIPFAVRQLRKHPSVNMYIIGAGTSGINMPTKVIVESNSKSTYQNAMVIKRIADQQGLDRIVLITTVDHFNRARYLIKNELPNIEIAPCPVPLTGMPVSKRLERWSTEYIKYIGTLIGIKDSK